MRFHLSGKSHNVQVAQLFHQRSKVFTKHDLKPGMRFEVNTGEHVQSVEKVVPDLGVTNVSTIMLTPHKTNSA